MIKTKWIKIFKKVLLLICLNITSNQVSSQIEVITGDHVIDCNSQNSVFNVPVKVLNFQNIIGSQFSLNWDTTKLSFVSINLLSFNPLGLNNSNFGTTNTANGILSFSWNDANLQGVSLMDSAQLLSIDFVQNTVSNFNSNISVSNSPTSIEFVDDNLNVVSYSVSNGSVNRNCFNCNISNVSNGQQSNCDPLTNYYTQELIIHHTNAPSNGNLSVNNKEFSIQPSPQTILLDSLNSDGSNQSVTVLFTSDSTCNLKYGTIRSSKFF